MSLAYDSVNQLFKSHPTLRLLRAEHAPVILAFLDRTFIQQNVRFISQSEIASRLEDMLYTLRETEGAAAFPRSAQAYLDEWVQNDKGWLRKFYPENSDEPHYDLTPAAEKALTWIESLAAREFVGTESRLLTIFELLRQMALGAEEDTATRIAMLEKKKQELDDEIAALRRGELAVMDGTALRDRFMQFSTMARELLADFRSVEHNFRQLDNRVRETIALWDGSKGALLEQIFGERDAITDSDQGRSFRAFWDFLMSPQSQEELTALLEKIFSLDALAVFREEKRLKRIHFDWLDAGEHTQRTVAGLSAQLRRYLDTQTYLENKRIMGILDSITVSALKLKDKLPGQACMEVIDPSAGIRLPMDRPLYTPPASLSITAHVQAADDTEIDFQSLLEQVYIDKDVLKANIQRELASQHQLALHDLIQKYPLKKGLAELVTYLALASESVYTVFDDTRRIPVEWVTAEGTQRRAFIPLIILDRRNNGNNVR